MQGTIRAFLVLVMLLIAEPGFSATNQRAASDQAGKAQSVSEELQAAKQQVKILESQLQVMKDYQSSLLDTVYWALGGVFLIVGLLLGFGWFSNFRIYERDKETLKADLELVVRSKGDELEKLTSSQLNRISSKLASQNSDEAKKIEAAMKSYLAPLDTRLFDLEFFRLHERMTKNDSDNMALTDALNLLGICVTRNHHQVPEIIHFMLKKIDKGGKFTPGEITRLNLVLDSLPSQYSSLCEKIGARLVVAEMF